MDFRATKLSEAIRLLELEKEKMMNLSKILREMDEGIKRDEEAWDEEEKQLVENLRIIKLLKKGLVGRKKSLEDFMDELEEGEENAGI